LLTKRVRRGVADRNWLSRLTRNCTVAWVSLRSVLASLAAATAAASVVGWGPWGVATIVVSVGLAVATAHGGLSGLAAVAGQTLLVT